MYAYLTGGAEAEARHAHGSHAIAIYAEVEFLLLTMLCFLHAAQHGIEHRTTSHFRPRTPLHGGVLVDLPPAVHQLVDYVGQAAYFPGVSEYPGLALEAYEASRGMDWRASSDGLVGRTPGTIAWSPYVYYDWVTGRCFDLALESVAVHDLGRWADRGADLRYRVVELPGMVVKMD